MSGDLVEFDAAPRAGDAYVTDWQQTPANVAALRPLAPVPGRGTALVGEALMGEGLSSTAGLIADVHASMQAGASAGKDLNAVCRETFAKLEPNCGHWDIFGDCMPVDVTPCFDLVTRYPGPPSRTAEREAGMWNALESCAR